ncbi:MAG: hypothetical protein AMXMBFR83_11070 [Phycisphaerae bacterium]
MMNRPQPPMPACTPVAIVIGIALTLAGPEAAPAATAFVGRVPADWPPDVEAPVCIPCPPGFTVPSPLNLSLVVESQDGRKTCPGMLEVADAASAEGPRLWFLWTATRQCAGKPIRVTIGDAAANGPRPANPYVSKISDPQFHLATAAGDPVYSYWHGKPAPGQRYPLTDFIHPLIGLDGEVLTWLSPRDHVHHRGIFWAWVRHEMEGKPVGSWWQPDTIHLEPGRLAAGDSPVLSIMSARHDWVYTPKGQDQGRPFVSEQVICRTFRTTADGRAIDIDITLTALADGVRIGGTTDLGKGYGGFTFRYGSTTDRKVSQAAIVMDGKDTPEDLLTVHAKWGDWSAIFKMPDGNPARARSGAAVFVHPSHPEYPPEWLTRYYGVLNVSYPDLKMIDLPRDKPLRLKYRVWVHRGGAQEGRCDEHYRAYAADFGWKAG